MLRNGPSSPGDVPRGPLPSPAQMTRVSLLRPQRPGRLRNRHMSSHTPGGWEAKVKALASVGKMMKKVPALASIFPLRPWSALSTVLPAPASPRPAASMSPPQGVCVCGGGRGGQGQGPGFFVHTLVSKTIMCVDEGVQFSQKE